MEFFDPKDVSPPIGNYHHALLAPAGARLLFISGQIPTLSNGAAPHGFEAQCAAVWENIGKTLGAAGLGFPALIKVTTFLSDRAYADANGAIRRRYLGAHAPALTVVVATILDPAWLLEIEAVAVMTDNRKAP